MTSHETPTIDDPDTRAKLAEQSGVVDIIGAGILNRTDTIGVIVGGNYVANNGSAEEPDMLPTAQALEALTQAVSGNGPNRILVVARESVLHNPPLGHEAIRPAIIPARKKEGSYNTYEVLGEGMKRAIQHLYEGGILWLSPAATTEKDGLIFDINAGAVHLAGKYGFHFTTLAVIYDDTPKGKIVRKLYLEEIPLPSLPKKAETEEEKALIQEAEIYMTRYALAVVASHLPETQEHGEYKNFTEIQADMKRKLVALRDRGLAIEGVFLDF